MLSAMATTRIRKQTVQAPSKGAPLMVKVRPATADWIRRVSRTRRINNNSVIDILLDGFKRLPADVQASLFGDGAGAGAA